MGQYTILFNSLVDLFMRVISLKIDLIYITFYQTMYHFLDNRKMIPLSVMVWAGVSAAGRTPLIFVPTGVKINSKTYQDLI